MKYNYNKKGGYKSPAWTRKEGQSPTGGLNAKGRASAKAEGSNLKSQLSSGTSPRRVSFAARFAGMKGPMKKPNGEPTRKALALKKWGFGSVEAARNFAKNNKKSAQMGGPKSLDQLSLEDEMFYRGRERAKDFQKMDDERINKLVEESPLGYSEAMIEAITDPQTEYSKEINRTRELIQKAKEKARKENRDVIPFKDAKQMGGLKDYYQLGGTPYGGGSYMSYQQNPFSDQEQAQMEAEYAALNAENQQDNIQNQAELEGAQTNQATDVVLSAGQKAGDLLGKTMSTPAGIAGLGATALGAIADDDDATTVTAGEGLSAIGKGAAAGSMFGPIGTVAGGVIGGVGALIGRGKARKAKAEAEQKLQEKKDKIASKMSSAEVQGLSYSGSDFGNAGPMMAQTGGLMDYIQSKRQDMSPEQKADIEDTGEVTQADSSDFGVMGKIKRLKNKVGSNITKYTDKAQDALTIGGLTPGVGAIPDLINVGISGVRSAYNTTVGDTDQAKKSAKEMAMHGAAAVPIAGIAAGTGRIAAKYGPSIVKAAKGVQKGYKVKKKATAGENLLAGNIIENSNRFKMGGKKLPGGMAVPIPGSDAVEFKGRTHNEGGIMVDPNTEVEDKETMDKVTMKKGGKGDYFFSSYLKRGGMSYADMHKNILKKGGGQKEIDMLAKIQERDAGRNPKAIKAEMGGVKKMQGGGFDEFMGNIDQSAYDSSKKPLNFFDTAKETYKEKIGALKDKISDYKEGAADRQKNRALKKMYKDTPDIALAAGAAQMIPAMYAFTRKEKPVNKLSSPDQMVSPDLDRVNFNKERASNEASNRALNRFIETSGGGPANIASKMAAYSKKLDQDMKIAAAEERANAGVSNQEAQMRMNTQARNIANRMNVDAKNVSAMEAQRLREENNKKEAIDVAMKNVAGIASDVMQYQAEGDYARAIGNMGIAERQKLRAELKGTINKETGQPWTDAEITALYNEATKGQ